MRILHVISSLDPRHGGPPAVVIRLAAAQAALEPGPHDVVRTAIATYHEPEARARIEKARSAVPGGDRVPVHSLGPLGRLERFAARGARSRLRDLAREFDLLYMHGVWSPVVPAGAGAARAAGVPYVIRPAGMLDPWSLRQKALKKRIAMVMGYRAMLNGALFMHTLNTDERDLIVPLGLTCPLEVIPNGVFLQELTPLPDPGTFRAGHPEVGSDPFILFLSRLHYKKGLDYLADAFALVVERFPRARLVVAGPDEGARGEFEAQVARLGVAARVHLVGGVYGPDKLAAFVDATCLCLPSRQEGFSVAITEALACGLPAVVSRDCHFPEVGEAGAGEVVALDAREVAEALCRILGDEARRARMSRAGWDLVRTRFTWPSIAARTLEVVRARTGPARRS
ncbi:MAG: glycosyltransferase [Phycisphaerae bacterium]|nr:glycosyltransferase [Phycisphaerae bacterium]